MVFSSLFSLLRVYLFASLCLYLPFIPPFVLFFSPLMPLMRYYAWSFACPNQTALPVTRLLYSSPGEISALAAPPLQKARLHQ